MDLQTGSLKLSWQIVDSAYQWMVNTPAGYLWEAVNQGSVLGPVLFIFISNLPDAVNSALAIFTDDKKVYRIVQTSTVAVIIQCDIDGLTSWAIT